MASTIAVKIVGDATSLERTFKRANKSAAGFNRNMKGVSNTSKRGQGAIRGVGRAAGLTGGLLGVAGLAGAARAAFQEMAQSAKVTAQTNAVIKSTGGVANVSAKHVAALGDALLAKSGVDDETIRSGQNMLLTFRGIRNEAGKGNDIFDQTAKAVLDMNVAMTGGNVTQQSLAKASILVGKALQDPIRGLGSLRRVGVAFTAGEQAKIKALVASGRSMEAQKLILAELNKEFGGSAAALGGTLPGKINIARESFRNLGGALATQLVPALTRAANSVNKFLGNTKNQKAIIDGFRTALASAAIVLGTIRVAFQTLSRVVGGNRNAIIVLISAYAAFKAVQMASTIATIARSFGLLTTATNVSTAATARSTVATKAAAASTRGLRLGLVGKAGLVGAAGVAAFALTTLILKATGLDKKLKSAGGAAFDLASKLGLVNDPMKQFEGKRALTGKQAVALRARTRKLDTTTGLSDTQIRQKLFRENPNVRREEVALVANRALALTPIVVHHTTVIDGQVVERSVTEAQRKAAKRNTTQRRGRIGGR